MLTFAHLQRIHTLSASETLPCLDLKVGFRIAAMKTSKTGVSSIKNAKLLISLHPQSHCLEVPTVRMSHLCKLEVSHFPVEQTALERDREIGDDERAQTEPHSGAE